MNNEFSSYSYFFSQILQFQFHRGLCKIAQSKQPLYKCSIYKSKEAGKKFRYVYLILCKKVYYGSHITPDRKYILLYFFVVMDPQLPAQRFVFLVLHFVHRLHMLTQSKFLQIMKETEVHCSLN